MRQCLRPAIPTDMLADQFGFRPTGSTTCALVHFIHHATLMLENISYVRCLLMDFSKAFDVVKHAILMSKLSAFDLPPPILNWIITFLTDHAQVSKTPNGQFCIASHYSQHYQVLDLLCGLLWQVTSAVFRI